MPRFRQITEILRLMGKKERIRNICIVAHIDHGKTTMTDSLLADAGLLPPQVVGKARALDYLEEEQKRGITIKTANISLLHETDGQPHVINLVDTPGHVDFTGKVTRALRATDGAVVVVDAVEEIMAQTETVTRQAMQERVKPVLFINKIDRLITELRLNSESIQEKLNRIIKNFNCLIENYAEPEYRKKWKVSSSGETVAFGSALHGWGFTLNTSQKKGIKFTDITDAYKNEKYAALAKFLPLHDAILDMATKNCPCPIEAQGYRVPKIWKGKLDSEIGKAMLCCNDDGPTVMCVTNVQVDPKTGAVATVRLFSGSAKKGDQLHIVNWEKEFSISQVSIYMSQFRETVDAVPAGNIAALTGLDLVRIGETLVDAQYKNLATPFEGLSYVSEPVLTVALEPENPADLQHLSDALDRLAIEDPNLAVTINARTGEYLLSGIGELHLETAVKFLKEYSSGIEITVSKPTVDYRETVTTKGSVVMAKSLNKQNSFWIQAEPLEERTATAGALDEHGNTLINSARNVKHLGNVEAAIVEGFKWACRTGPLCEQPMRNVRINLLGAIIHENEAMREHAQIARNVSRAILGSFLTAKPALLEPIFRVEIVTPTQFFGVCTSIVAARRGKIQSTQNRADLVIITVLIPVAETFGLASEMRSATSGRAFWQSSFEHWSTVPEKTAKKIIKENRVKRGLPTEIPEPERFIEETEIENNHQTSR
jgi:elongation factor 2